MKHAIWRIAGCVLGVVAFAAAPALHAADGKSRVTAKHPAKSAAKASARKKHAAARHHAAAKHHAEPVTVGATPNLKSSAALVIDLEDGRTIYGKNAQNKTPIASITNSASLCVACGVRNGSVRR